MSKQAKKKKQSEIILETPPHDLTAEQAVLGGILLDGVLDFARELKKEDFYTTGHQTIFNTMLDMDAKGDKIDLITISNTLKNNNDLDDIGGASYLCDLMNALPTTANMPHYIRIVKEEAVKRQILTKVLETQDGLKNTDLSHLLADLRGFYTDIALMPTLEDGGFFDMDKIYEEGKAYAEKGKETGLSDLDKAIKIMPKELIIIGARVRHGKSSFAYNLLLNLLEKHEEETFVFFNSDVSSTVLVTRLATIWAKKHKGLSYAYKDVLPRFKDGDFQNEINGAFAKFHEYGIKKRLAVVNKPNYTVEQLIGHAERLAKEKPLGAIFVDYIELIKTDKKNDTEELRISHIVNQLRIASERLSCPIIALAQMNRTTAREKTPEKRRPSLEGLRYSGRQEQEATTVLGLFNHEAEKIDIEGQDGGLYSPTTETTLEVIPLKNRGGQSNKVIELSFDMISGYIGTKQKTGFDY